MTLPPSAMVAENRHIVFALDATQAVLDRQGWWNNSVWDASRPGSTICLHEAIVHSPTPGPWVAGAIYALSKAVAPDGRGTSLELIEWDEKRGRTKADVDALIHRVREANR